MSTAHNVLMTVVAATLFTAAGAGAAVNPTHVQPFESQSLQMKDYSTLDRHECRSLKARNLQQPKYCIYR